jgi:hypothetical protein
MRADLGVSEASMSAFVPFGVLFVDVDLISPGRKAGLLDGLRRTI